MTKRDDNKQNVSLAYDGTDSVPLKVDPVTGRLLIDVSLVSDAAAGATSKRDANKQNVALAVDSNGDVRPLICDPTNGYLYVDLVSTGGTNMGFVASAQASQEPAAAITCNKPTGTAEGDIMFAWIANRNSSNYEMGTVASGWTAVEELYGKNVATLNDLYNFCLYYKVAGASEPADYTFTWGGVCKQAIVIATFRRNFDSSDPIDVQSSGHYGGNDYTMRAATITPTGTKQTILYFGAMYDTDSATATPPTDYIEDVDYWNNSGDFNMLVARYNHADGATGNIDGISTGGGPNKHAIAVILNT